MPHKILIVDDQPDIRKLIVITMEAEGLELHEAANGQDAWQMAQTLRPDVVLLDVMMPGSLDGFDVCKKIKADLVLQNITKVVLLTARGQLADVAKGKAAGCDAYLIKPFSPLELLDTVDRLIQPS